jgi:hypothetical protein
MPCLFPLGSVFRHPHPWCCISPDSCFSWLPGIWPMTGPDWMPGGKGKAQTREVLIFRFPGQTHLTRC